MRDLLYRWPAAARFERPVPRSKFYEHSTIAPAVRERFVADVRRVTWAFKLAATTVNLPGSASVPEIQVFRVDAKGDDVDDAVLTAIDRAVRMPIIFEITRGDGAERLVRTVATHKQLRSGAPKLGSYYTTAWQPHDVDRTPLPPAVDLAALYIALLAPLTPLAARPGEEVPELAARLETVRRLEREVAVLVRKIRTEPQLNRKVDLRRDLKKKQAWLVDLSSPTQSPTSGTES